ncbi:hypothetical protein AAFF_G00191430 [Aldrovandia affinis]|uniref:Uncharacterized protein n=1 Tax=Aldrovandia affinis TaxID=143900 RepID=A0AAD7RM11_9TELE|nr:hypothetical protein AAFF_G00191430 [Aldrovandia affinis]
MKVRGTSSGEVGISIKAVFSYGSKLRKRCATPQLPSNWRTELSWHPVVPCLAESGGQHAVSSHSLCPGTPVSCIPGWRGGCKTEAEILENAAHCGPAPGPSGRVW